MLQDSNSNKPIMRRDLHTFVNEPDSLEDKIIYDIVIEYQAIVTNKNATGDDLIEIEPELQERYPWNMAISQPNTRSQHVLFKQPETTNLCQLL